MADLNADAAARREVMFNSPVIAIVGRSNDHYYTSYQVGEYLQHQGFKIYNVNPRLEVEAIDGEPVYESLADIPEPIDIVDVFRRSDALPGVVEEAIAVGAKTVWAQLGVSSDEARAKAIDAGLNYADDLCLRTEHQVMMGETIDGSAASYADDAPPQTESEDVGAFGEVDYATDDALTNETDSSSATPLRQDVDGTRDRDEAQQMITDSVEGAPADKMTRPDRD